MQDTHFKRKKLNCLAHFRPAACSTVALQCTVIAWLQLLEIIWLTWGKRQQASCSSTGCGSPGRVGQLQSKHYYSSSAGPGETLPASLEESNTSREYSSLDFCSSQGTALRPPNSHTFSKDRVYHQWAVFSHKLSNRLWAVILCVHLLYHTSQHSHASSKLYK